jgi:hypothetical protein
VKHATVNDVDEVMSYDQEEHQDVMGVMGEY